MSVKYTNRLTLTGYVTHIDVDKGSFKLKCRSENEFEIYIGPKTGVDVIKNLDNINRDRCPTAGGYDSSQPSQVVKKYIRLGRLVIAEGILQKDHDQERIDARTIHLLQNNEGDYLFENPHWWLSQISRMSDVWLNTLFGQTQTYEFSNYHTNLDILGIPTKSSQECATLSRLIYGLSSAYLLTGDQRYVDAARAGVIYQREYFRSISHDGQYVFWAFAVDGKNLTIPSQNGDDLNTIPLYEQIYALAGMTQFYRITLDPATLHDIRRTVAAFDKFFLDETDYGGYFSHIDPATMSPNSDFLANNQLKKNWNSNGDHIPAYLVNLILALNPLSDSDDDDISDFLKKCQTILERTSTIILEKFPDPNPDIPYVCERFFQDWTQDLNWGWQQNGAVCGHNLKIAWNLTRVANYYKSEDDKKEFVDKLMTETQRLGDTMGKLAVDQIRSGVYDVVEREPKNGMPLDFAWWNTKDFWQQEQGILAYLILYGCTGKEDYLAQAREISAFWNTFFVNHDDLGMYFRVTADGLPYLVGQYRDKGGHAKSGYHTFELCYLTHIYTSTFVTKKSFCLHFKPEPNGHHQAINVLPDFLPPDSLKVTRVNINGIDQPLHRSNPFHIRLDDYTEAPEIIVEFAPQQY